MTFLTKLLFLIKSPTLIVVTGHGRSCAAEAIFQVLKNNFSVKKISSSRKLIPCLGSQILIFESDIKKVFELRFLTKKARQAILVVSAVGEIPADEYFFAGEKEGMAEATKLIGLLRPQDCLVLNFDDETVRDLKAKSPCPVLTFGFQDKADFQASDVKITESGTNFKLNYKGNIVPVWLKEIFGKEQIYSGLAAISTAAMLGMNLVEASQELRFYDSLPGKMRLIQGNKNSRVLDDSENSSLQSMLEALVILQEIKNSRIAREKVRTIAVLGDVLALGKYTLSAHETIGERAAKVCDRIFTVGERAKFIVDGAMKAGMLRENIFQFDDAPTAAQSLEKEIKEGDLILVDGAKEMEMWKAVEEIKSF